MQPIVQEMQLSLKQVRYNNWTFMVRPMSNIKVLNDWIEGGETFYGQVVK